MNKTVVFFFILLFTPAVASSAPSISTVSGQMSSGQSITISGSGFGGKSPAAPLIWSNFDNGTNGTNLSNDSNWPAYSGSAKYTSSSPYGGVGLCVYNTGLTEFATNYHIFTNSYDELYYTYRSRYVGTGVRIYKNGRINTGGNLYSGDGMIAISDGYVFYRSGSTSAYPSDRYFTGSNIASASWTRHELYGKVSSPAGTSNGRIFASVGLEAKDYSPIVSRDSGFSFQYNSVILGLMMANVVAGDSHYMYIDDVYIDKTLARVEMCAGSTWADKGDCDPQVPTSWSDTGVSVTVNAGAKTGTTYLYVVDSNGAVNSAGYSVIVGGGQVGCSPTTREYCTIDDCETTGDGHWYDDRCNADEEVETPVCSAARPDLCTTEVACEAITTPLQLNWCDDSYCQADPCPTPTTRVIRQTAADHVIRQVNTNTVRQQ